MDQKSCFRCGEIKLIDEFYKHPRMSDGHLGKCKTCTKSDVRKHRASEPDRHREYEKKRYDKSPARRESCRRHASEWASRNKEKRVVHGIVGRAIKSGLLAPEPCETCLATSPIHAHHDDYAKPLEVRWLCASCHRRHHASRSDV